MSAHKAQLYKYKGNMCTSCGKSVQEMLERYGTFCRLFDLHHVEPSKKDDNYNNLIRQKLSTKQLDEVDKCVLLCKECHGLIHAQNKKVEGIILSIDYDGKTESQELNGWLVFDYLEKTIKIIYEGDLLLEPYVEKLNESNENTIFGVNLHSGLYLIDKFKSLSDGDVYTIHDAHRGHLLLKVEQIEGVLKIKHAVEFKFVTLDGSKAPKGTRFWFRNGCVLHENGDVQCDGDISFSLAVASLP